MDIRAEQKADSKAIWRLNERAFTTSAEAELVNALREQEPSFLSLVAEQQKGLVGHIAFTEFRLSPNPHHLRVAGLAPMAVEPDCQREGIGAALIDAGLAACQQQGFDAVVVFGHPDYYPRFGFKKAADFGMSSVLEVPDNVFMVLALEDAVWDKLAGHISLPTAFNML